MKTRMFIAMSVLLFGIVAARTGFAADEFKPDKDGFIRDWLLLSPIQLAWDADGAEAIDKSQVADEASLKPKAGDKAKAGNKELEWKKVKSQDFFLDLNAIAKEQTEKTVAYAVCYINCEDERKELQVKMGSNDQGKVYLNGKAVVKASEPRTMDQDSDVARNITLNKGVNVLVFKIFNDGGSDWQGCLRFTDSKGKAVTDLAIKLEP